MYLLDTDHISLLGRGGTGGERIRERVVQAPTPIYICVISYEEQIRGWLAQINKTASVDKQIEYYERLEQTLKFFGSIPMLSFDMPVVEVFQTLWMQRIRIGTMDLKIAATALAHDATLLTRNTSDFAKVPGLRVEDWSVL